MRPIFSHKMRAFVFGVSLLSGTLISSAAYAGELKFGEGADSLQTDDAGKLTSTGGKTAVKEIDKVIGEDAWDLKIWARVDRAVAGPMYIEFYRSQGGKEYIVHRHEMNFEGGKYLAESVMLEGGQGFNKNSSYKVIVIQNDGKKDLKLATAKIKLIKSDREAKANAAAAAETGDEDGGEGAADSAATPDCSEQDRLDGFCGTEATTAGADAPAAAAEPPVTQDPSRQKGCSIGETTPAGGTAAAILLLVGLGATHRRRLSRQA